MNPICSLCRTPVQPNQERVSTFVKDAQGYTVERGAIHVSCLDKLWVRS